MKLLAKLWFCLTAAYLFGFLAGRYQAWYAIAEFSGLMLVGMTSGYYCSRWQMRREAEQEAAWEPALDSARWTPDE